MPTVKEILNQCQIEQVKLLSGAVGEDKGPAMMLKLVRANVDKAMRLSAQQYKDDKEFDYGRDISVEVDDTGGKPVLNVKALSPAGKRFKEWLAKQSA